jgi:hypothetical protein
MKYETHVKPWRAAVVTILLYGSCAVADHQQHADWPDHVHSWLESALVATECLGISILITAVLSVAFAWMFGALDRKNGS